jgi:hypothetical protein
MLELILTVGNYMNSSAKSYEPIHGFDISFLPKVIQTNFPFLSIVLRLNSFIQQKLTMVVVLYFILLFKLSKINIVICSPFLMNSILLLMVYRKVRLYIFGRDQKKLRVSLLVNILELQKQPKEINRELKNAREELDIAKNVEEQIEGDKFAESIEVKLMKRRIEKNLVVF